MTIRRRLLPVLVTLGLPACKDQPASPRAPAPGGTANVDTNGLRRGGGLERVDAASVAPRYPMYRGGAVVSVPPRRDGGAPVTVRPGATRVPAVPQGGSGRAAAPAAAAAPSASADEGAVYLAHNHPPGTPCTPVTDDEINAALREVRGQ